MPEFYSVYLDMVNFYSQDGLEGFANGYEGQPKEEQKHAIRVMKNCHCK